MSRNSPGLTPGYRSSKCYRIARLECSMSRRPAAITLIALAILALVAPASIGIAEDNAPARAKSGGAHVYILRGFMNLSPGLDELAGKVQARGVPATVINNLGWSSLVDHAVQN